MNETDFDRIGQLVAQILDRLDRIDARFDAIDTRLDAMDDRIETFKSEIITEFNHSLGIKFEELTRHFQVAAEGHAGLTERVDRLEVRVEGDETKLENLSLELLAHRRSPEAHHPDGFRVKETETGFMAVPRVKVKDPKGEEIKRRFQEILDKEAKVTAEVNAYYAEVGVVPPEIDYDEENRRIALSAARYRVERELKRRREEEQKGE